MNEIQFINFPAVTNADEDGLLAMGGDLTVDTLVSAYSQGIFPWFNQGQPTLWWSPDPRLVLFPHEVKVSRSLAKRIRQQQYQVTANQAFNDVIESCAYRGQNLKSVNESNTEIEDTCITYSMKGAYTALHKLGYAHSIEVWEQDNLVGGLYGLSLGDVFFGESMFSVATDSSKVALATLCAWLKTHGWRIIDCQVSSPHLLSLGAREIQRTDFLQYLSAIDIDKTSKSFAKDITQCSIDSVINKV